MKDKELKDFMDMLSELGICKKEEDGSDEIDCQYVFNDTDGILRTTKKCFDILPDNWGIDYWQIDNDDASKGLIRYFTAKEQEKQ